MVPWRATGDGEVTPELLAWYGRFAEGRPGAIVVEATGIGDVPSGPLLRIGDDRFVAGLSRVADVIRDRSGGQTRAFIQLIDFLRVRRRPAPDRFFRDFLTVTPAHRQRLIDVTGETRWALDPEPEVRARLAALSEAELEAVLSARELDDLRRGARERVTDTHLPQIRDLPVTLPPLFAAAARRAEMAGFDGVELHYAHAYTMASFLSALNTRDDGYGRSREGRVRLPLAVYHAVRGAVGPGMVVGCRLLGDEAIAGGSDLEDAAWFAVALARAGVDYVSLSKGGKFEDARAPRVGEAIYPYTGPSGEECIPHVRSGTAHGRHLPLARRVRAAIRAAGFATPVVAAGGLTTFALAEGALRRGDADACAAARQSLADPDWWLKLRLGRGAEIRRCTLSSYCEGLDQRHKRVTCRLWDRLPMAPGESSLRDGDRRLVAPPWRR